MSNLETLMKIRSEYLELLKVISRVHEAAKSVGVDSSPSLVSTAEKAVKGLAEVNQQLVAMEVSNNAGR